MNIETKQINITTAHSEDVLSVAQIKINDIRLKIIELWDKQPIISQFPDIITVVEPTQQIAIAMQGKMVTISNQEIKSFETRDLENLIRLVLKTNELIDKPIIAFGYNFTFLVPIATPADGLTIKNKMKTNISLTSMEIPEADFLAGGVNLSYMKSSERVQITIIPQFAEDLKNPIAFIGQCNLHFFKDALPSLTDLVASFNLEHGYLKGEIDKILS